MDILSFEEQKNLKNYLSTYEQLKENHGFAQQAAQYVKGTRRLDALSFGNIKNKEDALQYINDYNNELDELSKLAETITYRIPDTQKLKTEIAANNVLDSITHILSSKDISYQIPDELKNIKEEMDAWESYLQMRSIAKESDAYKVYEERKELLQAKVKEIYSTR